MFRMENPQISAGKYDVNTAKKKFSFEDFFSKCDQIRSKLRI